MIGKVKHVFEFAVSLAKSWSHSDFVKTSKYSYYIKIVILLTKSKL